MATINIYNKPTKWDIFELICIVIIIIIAISSFSCLSAQQRKDKRCAKRLEYLENNCPDLIAKGSVTAILRDTIEAETIHDTLLVQSVCDTLIKYVNTDTTIVLSYKKEGKLSSKIYSRKGKLYSDCKSDTVYIKKTIVIPCDFVVTWDVVKAYFHAKFTLFYARILTYWWVLIIIVAIIAAGYVVFKFAKPL